METLAKMDTISAAAFRTNIYDIVTKTLEENGMATEPVKGGRLIDLGNGYYGKIAVSICDPAKIEIWREEYAEQLRKKAERAQAHADKEAEKARKAAEKAAKKNTEKTGEVISVDFNQ